MFFLVFLRAPQVVSFVYPCPVQILLCGNQSERISFSNLAWAVCYQFVIHSISYIFDIFIAFKQTLYINHLLSLRYELQRCFLFQKISQIHHCDEVFSFSLMLRKGSFLSQTELWLSKYRLVHPARNVCVTNCCNKIYKICDKSLLRDFGTLSKDHLVMSSPNQADLFRNKINT